MKRVHVASCLISKVPAQEVTRTGHGWGEISSLSPISSRYPAFTRFLLAALIVLVLCSGAARAQEDSTPTAQTPASSETPAETTAEESSAEDVVWPPPFNPSEEIGADAQISFPTDI
jgi:hypothetical protein